MVAQLKKIALGIGSRASASVICAMVRSDGVYVRVCVCRSGYLGVPGGTWGYLGVPGGLGEEGCVQRRASVARPDATLLPLL